MNVGRGYVMNVGRGYVIHNHDSVGQQVGNEGGHRAARAAKKGEELVDIGHGSYGWCWVGA